MALLTLFLGCSAVVQLELFTLCAEGFISYDTVAESCFM